MSGKYLCVHAHFYQPPRENPWIEEVEVEDSAAPFHDWNERITSECYWPNSASRVLSDGKIERVVNNYRKISFNLGPTLLSWMETHHPVAYDAIVAADRKSVEEREGHGNAIAQSYNHSIMPLHDRRDKETQIIWGIRDFEYRFGRKPEGMWFAETAVDGETLSLAAKHGIKFTILSPTQAKRVRMLDGKGGWKDVLGSPDTTRPYLFRPSGGEEIAIFFYDGDIAHSIAFGGALNDGRKLGTSIIGRFRDDAKEDRLMHVATDGESYGHHHRFGEMALSAVIETVEKNSDIKIINYGQYLAGHPPTMEVEIYENSSWSCAHGVERWRSDCGCSTGGGDGWNQKWRKPLRDGLNLLKNRLDYIYETGISRFVASPWDARNDYVNVVLARNPENIKAFFERNGSRSLSREEITDALKYLEMQNAAMKMFTSCGWFFSDISGLEAVQILKYAAKAIDLAEDVSLNMLEPLFMDALSEAKSNIARFGTGADIYRNFVMPLKLDPRQVAAHEIIVDSLREEEKTEELTRLYCFTLRTLDSSGDEFLDVKIQVGRLKMESSVTMEVKDFVFCLLYFGGHDFNCSIRPFIEMGIYNAMKRELLETFHSHSIPEIIHAVEKHFGQNYYTLKALFSNERRMVIEHLVGNRIEQFTDAYEKLFEKNRKLMDYFADINVPIPEEFRVAAKYVFDRQLGNLFKDFANGADVAAMTSIMTSSEKWGLRLGFNEVRKNIESFIEEKLKDLCDGANCESARVVIKLMGEIGRHGIEIDKWKIQNRLYPYVEALRNKNHPLHAMVVSIPEFRQLFEIFGFVVPTA